MSSHGKIEIFRGIGMTADQLRELLDDKFSMADLAVIDSGPGATANQGATIAASDFVVIVENASWGSNIGTEMLEALCEQHGKPCIVVANQGDAFPEIGGLQNVLLKRKVPRQFEDGLDEIISASEGAAVIGVVGGKGGVGKTTIAAALALYVAKDGKVLIIDMDDQAGCITNVVAGTKDAQQGHRHKWEDQGDEPKHTRKRRLA